MKTISIFLLFLLLNVVPSLSATQPYIVYMGAHTHGADATTEDFDRVTDYHHEFLASFLGSYEEARESIFDSYTKRINGFAANLEDAHAAEIAKHPDVVSVFVNKGKKTQTTHSWDFMLLENNGVISPKSIWSKANFGDDIIIGNVDTGVWPESKSFSDEGFQPAPSRWKGQCEDISGGVPCNRKLIGARHFNKGYKAFGGHVNKTMDSGRDFAGHGSHTLSTAGGNFVPGASLFGALNGTARGGSPKARVASYKVCWTPINGSECFDSDIMAAFDMAIHDGVDVLSVSLGGDSAVDYFEDGLAIGSFHAVQHGVTVLCSAGNSGPSAGTVTNVAPWMLTVGASTIDRKFQSFAQLGDGQRFEGESLTTGLPKDQQYPLLSAAKANAANATSHDALLCKPGTLDHDKVKGKILVCLRGDTDRVDKGMQAKLAGAVGMILCNDEADANEIFADYHFLPTVQLTYKDGSAVFAYINSTDKPMGYITGVQAKLGIKPAPTMADFSSRGPNTVTPEILKPDITAPGVNIIAAYSEAVSPTEETYDTRRVPYAILSGTSMSCPHAAGVVGLLKSIYPEWSPAAIRSAIMTTARTRDNSINPIVDADNIEATPFSYGSGHVRPNAAMNPGLIYDISRSEYLDFICALGYNSTVTRTFYHGSHRCPDSDSTTTLLNFNYPSFSIPKLSGSVTVTRTVKNVGSPGIYASRVRHPAGVSVTVEPEMLNFKKVGEKKKFKVTFTSTKKASKPNDYHFGDLTWTDGKHYVRSPISVAFST